MTVPRDPTSEAGGGGDAASRARNDALNLLSCRAPSVAEMRRRLRKVEEELRTP